MLSAIQLTTKDFSILETMLERRAGQSGPLIPLLRAKLAAAQVVFRDDLPPGTVALDCRVVFRVNREQPQTRILVQNENDLFEGRTLSVSSVRGLSLIGLKEGQQISIRDENGETEAIDIIEVRDCRFSFLENDTEGKVTPLRTRKMMPRHFQDDDDPDPGPTAA